MVPFYPTDEGLQNKIDEYFAKCDEGVIVQVVRKGVAVDVKKATPYTVPGLAYFLGYANRQALFDLGQQAAHSDTIRRALTRIEEQRVVKALVGEQDSRFAQFDLVNNFKYVSSAAELHVTSTVTTLSDDELAARIAQLERKMVDMGSPLELQDVDGTWQPKLVGG